MKKTMIAILVTIAVAGMNPALARYAASPAGEENYRGRVILPDAPNAPAETVSTPALRVTGWMAFLFVAEFLAIVGVQFMDRPRRKKTARQRPTLRALPDPGLRESPEDYVLLRKNVL